MSYIQTNVSASGELSGNVSHSLGYSYDDLESRKRSFCIIQGKYSRSLYIEVIECCWPPLFPVLSAEVKYSRLEQWHSPFSFFVAFSKFSRRIDINGVMAELIHCVYKRVFLLAKKLIINFIMCWLWHVWRHFEDTKRSNISLEKKMIFFLFKNITI